MTARRYARGERIAGRYTVHARMRGGMGEVYLCLDEETKQPLALKTPWLEDESDTHRAQRTHERFLREARAWVSLGQHPNIVRCFYLDTIDDRPWIFLEWIAVPDRSDVSLRALLKQQGALEVETALRLALDVAHGLAWAVEAQPGLVHRDLKPGNLLIAQDLTAKLSDFGLARTTATRRQSGGGAGTPAYRPPEQWQRGDVDARADLYALGLVLYEMLLGAPVFPGSDEAFLRQAHAETAPPHLPAHLPPEVDAFVQRCLAKDPDERPQSAVEAAAALAHLLRTVVGVEPPPAPLPGALAPGDLVNRGNTFLRLQRDEDALAEYNAALALDADFAPALVNRGAFHWLRRRPDEALADLDRAIRSNRRSHAGYYNRGVIHAALGQHARAMQDFNAALVRAPGHASALYNRGNLLRVLGNLPQALVDYSRAIAVAPTMVEAHHNRGLTHVELNDYQAALADLTRALEIKPDLAASRYNRAVVYQILGAPEKAIEDLTVAVAAQPRFRQAWELRGVLHHQAGQLDEAINDYTEAILIGPEERVDLYYNRGLACTELGMYDAALLNYDHAVAVDRHYLPVHLERARTLLLAGREQEAYDVAEALLMLGFDSPGLHDALHQIFAALGNEPLAAQAQAQAQAERLRHGLDVDAAPAADAAAAATVAALNAFLEATTPETVQSLLIRYPQMADPPFIALAEDAIRQRTQEGVAGDVAATATLRRRQVADEARLLWLRMYARLEVGATEAG